MSKPSPLSKAPVHVNGIIYAEPGAGKTTLAGTAPNVLIMDADFGTESLATSKRDFGDVDVWRVEDFNDLSEAFTYVRNEDHDYQWVFLDSGSIFEERALHDQIMTDLVADKPHMEEFVPSMREYLVVQNQLAKFIRHFCGLPINFGLTAYPMDYDIGEKKTVVLPMLGGNNGKYTQKICGYMNFIGFLGIVQDDDKVYNRLLTQRSGRYYAKNRFGLPPVIENPNLADITEQINKAQGA